MTYSMWKERYAAQKYAEGLEKKRQRNMEWFLTEFLPSVAKRIGNNPNYPNSCIVSEKQANVLCFYMERDNYGNSYAEISTGRYELQSRGNWWALVKVM